MSWGSRGGARASKSKSCQFMLQCLIIGHQAGKKTLAALSTSGLCRVSLTYFLEMSQNRREPSSCYDAKTFYYVSMSNGWELQLNESKNVNYFCKRLADCTCGRYHAQVAWIDGNPVSLNLGYEKGKKYLWVFIHQVGDSQVGRLQRWVNKKMSQTSDLVEKLPSEGCVCM